MREGMNIYFIVKTQECFNVNAGWGEQFLTECAAIKVGIKCDATAVNNFTDQRITIRVRA
jgi:hypothetical protein